MDNQFNTSSGGSRLQYTRSHTFKDKYSINSSTMKSSLFAMIALVLFAIVFSHYIRTGSFINFSFKSLIDYLAGMPDVSLAFSTIDLSINSDWGVFNFLVPIINTLTSFIEVTWTMSGMIIQAFIVIGYLLGLFFI